MNVYEFNNSNNQTKILFIVRSMFKGADGLKKLAFKGPSKSDQSSCGICLGKSQVKPPFFFIQYRLCPSSCTVINKNIADSAVSSDQ